MRTWLSISIGAAGLLLASYAVAPADDLSLAASAGQTPPVSQTLVREGEFALQLAAALDLGSPTEESAAEDMLAAAGIAPSNGWLSDYPVTPQIIGQLEDAVSKAAGSGKLPMTSRQAVQGLYALAARMDLPTPAGAARESADQGQRAPSVPAAPANPGVVNNYYYNQGPPVVTYYPPPQDFVYLYDWVPYPVWWFGFWWPGFYICHDFTTVVVVRSAPVIVTNHVVIAGTQTVAIVDPVGRGLRAAGPPATVIRTNTGASFRTYGEFRQTLLSGRVPEHPGAGSPERRLEGFTALQARRGAENILSQSLKNAPARPAQRPDLPGRTVQPPYGWRGSPERSFGGLQPVERRPGSVIERGYGSPGGGPQHFRSEGSAVGSERLLALPKPMPGNPGQVRRIRPLEHSDGSRMETGGRARGEER